MKLKITSISFLTLLFTLTTLNAQEYDINNNFGLWNEVFITKKFDSKWSTTNEFHFRSGKFAAQRDQILIRPSLSYQFDNGIKFSSGYTYIENYNYEGSGRAPKAIENNMWEQISYRIPFKGFSVFQWIRLEHRWTNGFKNRFRYRFEVSKPLGEVFNTPISAFVLNELFIVHNKKLRPFSVNQNWVYMGFDFNLNKNLRLRTGYHNIYIPSSLTSAENRHIWETFLFITL